MKIANIAQVVNVIAPILTRGDQLLKQSIFYVFKLFSEVKSGIALNLTCDGLEYETKTYGLIPYIDSSAIFKESEKQLVIFLVNRSTESSIPISILTSGLPELKFEEGVIITHSDLKASNCFENPNNVVPESYEDISLLNNEVRLDMPKASFLRIILKF